MAAEPDGRDPTWHEQQELYTLKRIALALEDGVRLQEPHKHTYWTCESCDCSTNVVIDHPTCRVCGRRPTD